MNIYDIINITDSIHGTIQTNYIEKELISTPLFNRLHKVIQSSMAYRTFPSNKTSRFEHSLGTMHLAGQMFYYSVLNADKSIIENFLAPIGDQIKLWVRDEAQEKTDYIETSFLKGTGRIVNHQTITDIKGTLFNLYLPSNLAPEHRFAYIITLQAVRIAALLHDIGHFPYSHTVEKAINEVYHTVSEKPSRNDKEQKFFDCLQEIYEKYGQNELHEIISIKITDTILKNTEKELYHKIPVKNEENDINKCIISLSFYLAKLILSDHNDFFTDIHSLIDGVLDADRLDYVCRDTYNSGIRSDIINYSRLMSTMKLVAHYNSDLKRHSFYFTFQAKLVRELEEVLNRRWRICCDIHQHHRVCKTEILLVSVIKNLSNLYFNEPVAEGLVCDKCEECDKKKTCPHLDPGQMILSENISGLWKSIELLNEPNSETLEYMFIQLDDSWFDTMLKKEGFSRFEWPLSDELISCMEEPLHVQLDEIISNKKRYCSLIKRTIDFIDFDVEIIKSFFSSPKYAELAGMLDNIRSTTKRNTDSSDYTDFVLINNYINGDAKLYYDISKNTDKPMIDLYPPNHGFFFNSMYELICDLNVVPAFLRPKIKSLETSIEKSVMAYSPKILDCISSVVNIKTGYNSKRPINLIDKNNRLIPMSKISLEESSLKKEQKFMPGFFVFMSLKEPVEKTDHDFTENLKKVIGESVAETILAILINRLKESKNALDCV